MTIICSDYRGIIVESSLDRRKQFTERSADILNSEFRGRRRFEGHFTCSAHCNWRVNCDEGSVILLDRRGIWWCWRAHFVAPRIVKDISYVRRIKNVSHFVWQAQYLARFEGHFTCSAYCKWHFIRDEDESRKSFCLTGAVLGEVWGSLYLLRAL